MHSSQPYAVLLLLLLFRHGCYALMCSSAAGALCHGMVRVLCAPAVDTISQVIGSTIRDDVLSYVYMLRCDLSSTVRHAALQARQCTLIVMRMQR